MSKILVVDGAIAFRTYVLHTKNANGLQGVIRRVVTKRDEAGDVTWSKEYFYKKYKRTPEQIEKLVAQGKNPDAQSTKYYEKILGDQKPAGFKEDYLTKLLEEGKVELRCTALVTDEDTFEYIKYQVAPEYFSELEYFKI